MSQSERVKVQLKNFFTSTREQDDEELKKDKEKATTRQYRLEPSRRNTGGWFCCTGAAGAGELSDIKPNERLASSLHWMFRSNFLVLFTVMCICFFAWILLFAGLITSAGLLDRECVRVGKEKTTRSVFIQNVYSIGSIRLFLQNSAHYHY